MLIEDLAYMAKANIMTFLHGRPWAISADMFDSLMGFLSKHEGDVVNLASLKAAAILPLKESGKPPALYSMQGDSAVIGIEGALDKKMTLLHWLFGGTSTEAIVKSIEAALADPAVKGIVLNIDSPGGSVDGVKELSDVIYNARGKKPVVAYVDSNAMSAAYWIASAADKIVAPETARVGNIGVYMTHVDISQRRQQDGVKVSFIAAGKYKVAGNSEAPLTPGDREYLQGFVDKFYSLFVNDVARNRGVSVKTVQNKMADGQVFIGADALDAGLIDKIGSFETALKRTGKSSVKADSNLQIEVEAVNPSSLSQVLDVLNNELAGVERQEAYSHNSSLADSEPSWGGVDKTKLPRVAFAEKGTAGEKSSWGFPHHWVKGGSKTDKDGVYTDGTLFLHKGGLSAAWGAANGARSGKQASDAVRNHLRAHRTVLGMKSEWDEHEWLAEAKEVFGVAFNVSFKDWYLVRKTNKQEEHKEEKIMDLKEFKETYPDIAKAVGQEAVTVFKASEEYAGLDASVKSLNAKVEALETTNRELNKQAALAEEKSSELVAEKEMTRILSTSSLPERLHDKVKKQVDFRKHYTGSEKFVEGAAAFTAFSTAFATEVADWEKEITGSVSRASGSGEGKEDGNKTDDEALIAYGRKLAKGVTGKIRSEFGK